MIVQLVLLSLLVNGVSSVRLLEQQPSPGTAFNMHATMAATTTTQPDSAGHVDTPSHWGYDDIANWNHIAPACAGQAQSPINIRYADVVLPTTREFIWDLVDYTALPSRTVVNHGHNVEVPGGFGVFKLPDGNYQALQFHVHFPSEHQIDGKHAAGEIHIVHQREGANGTDGLAVIGILLEIPTNNTIIEEDPIKAARQTLSRQQELGFLQNLGFLGQLPQEDEVRHVNDTVDLNDFFPELMGEFFHYKGSLTTPPCSETVHWYVLQQPAAVTSEMVSTFKNLFPSPANDRPVQPLNGRQVIVSKIGLPNEFQGR